MSDNKPFKIDSIPAFCITLERRLDRWKRFQDQPGINKLQVKRFIGVDGKTLNINTDPRVALSTKRNILKKYRRSHEELDSIGGVGCALSHIAVWQWMVDNNVPQVLIFEDDAVVPFNFAEKANGIIANSPTLSDPARWDLWLLGGRWGDLTPIAADNEATKIDAFYLFHAYVMTIHGAKKLLKEVYPIHCHIDLWVSLFAYVHPSFRMVGSPNLILSQTTAVKTDIQSDKGCVLCDIPIDYDKTHMMISKTEWKIAQVAEVTCIVLAGYILYTQLFRKRD